MRYPLVCVLALALGVVGCNETSGKDGSGGAAGAGGTAGMGGSAGASGNGGTAGAGGDRVPCQPTTDRCTSGVIEPHEPCCEQPVPDQENACDGTESTENPTSCTPTGSTVTHRLTVMELEEDCNVGYDLDSCEGQSCVPSSALAPAEGMSGVDNGLAGLAPVVETVTNLRYVNKGLSDSLCGLTANAEREDCLREIPPNEVRFAVDANASERCANVTVLAGGEAQAHILNLSDDGCASGTLGTIPLTLFGETGGALSNTVVQMTVSSAGFSDGRLGATMDFDTLLLVTQGIPVVPAGGPIPWLQLDVSASTPPTRDSAAACDGLSATFVIGGVAEAQP